MTDIKLWHINNLHLDANKGTISNEWLELKLQAKVLSVLLYLLQTRATVSSEELISAIWQGNEHIGKRGVLNAIAKLRKVFNELGLEDAVVNVPKIGYHLNKTFKIVAVDNSACDSEAIRQPLDYHNDRLACEETSSQDKASNHLPAKKPIIGINLVLYMLGVGLISFLLATYDRDWTSNGQTQITQLPMTLLHTGSGEKFEITSDPNAEMVYFTWENPANNQWDIYRKPIGEPDNNAVLVTDDDEYEFGLQFDKSGRKLYFARYKEINKRDVYELVELDLLTNIENMLGQIPTFQFVVTHQIQNDGKQLIYMAPPSAEVPAYQLIQRDIETGNNRLLHRSNSRFIELEAKLKTLVYVTLNSEEDYVIDLIDLETGNITNFYATEDKILDIKWLNDQLVVSVQSGSNNKLLLLEQNGEITSKQVLNAPAWDIAFGQNKLVTFSNLIHYSIGLVDNYRDEEYGAKLRILKSSKEQKYFSPSLAKEAILFESQHKHSSRSAIESINLKNGEHLSLLVSEVSKFTTPTWHQSGQQFAYVELTAKEYSLNVYKEGLSVSLYKSKNPLLITDWQDSEILFVEGSINSELKKIDYSGNAPETIVQDVLFGRMDKNNRDLLYVKAGENAIHSRNLVSGETAIISDKIHPNIFGSWDASDNGVITVDHKTASKVYEHNLMNDYLDFIIDFSPYSLPLKPGSGRSMDVDNLKLVLSLSHRAESRIVSYPLNWR